MVWRGGLCRRLSIRQAVTAVGPERPADASHQGSGRHLQICPLRRWITLFVPPLAASVGFRAFELERHHRVVPDNPRVVVWFNHVCVAGARPLLRFHRCARLATSQPRWLQRTYLTRVGAGGFTHSDTSNAAGRSPEQPSPRPAAARQPSSYRASVSHPACRTTFAHPGHNDVRTLRLVLICAGRQGGWIHRDNELYTCARLDRDRSKVGIQVLTTARCRFAT